jgi:glycosyltransferase involved in cell wall biosynthesis
LVQLLRTERVEVLHIHLVGYTGGRWALLAARLARVPATVCTIQITPAQRERWLTRLDRRITTAGVDRFIAVSQVSRQRLVDYLGQSPAKIAVIPNAVELERYATAPALAGDSVRTRHGVSPDAVLLGAVARLSPQKGLSYLIDALPAIVAQQPRVQVLLVGDGPLRAALEAQATALGVRDRVHFAGPQEDVPSYLRAMDLFVLPSLFEGLPLAVLEAMAAALPVVATAVDGTPEAVEDGVTGRLVPPRDAAAFAETVLDLLRDPAAQARMGAAGRARANEFSVEALVDHVSSVYAEVLGRR